MFYLQKSIIATLKITIIHNNKIKMHSLEIKYKSKFWI